jgi:uncharacterized protein (TIGR00369 family)
MNIHYIESIMNPSPEVPKQDSIEGEPTWRTLGNIPELKNNSYFKDYVEGSRDTYASHHMNFEDIELSDDGTSAKLEFSVESDMQANPGVLHGGLSVFYADTVVAPLVMARHPECQTLTTSLAVRFMRPGRVGARYITEAQFQSTATEGEGQKKIEVEVYDVSIKDVETGKAILEGSVNYYPKPISPAAEK